MANIKRVHIIGDLPFDLGADERKDPQRMAAHQTVHAAIASLNYPSVGIRIRWGGNSRLVPNKHGGKTTFVVFEMVGEEGYRWEFFNEFRLAVQALGGTIGLYDVQDIDNPGDHTYLDNLAQFPHLTKRGALAAMGS